MKIGIYLEGSSKMGGGFFQSLKSAQLLLDIDKYKSKIELITTNNEAKKYFLNENVKNQLYKPNKLLSYFLQFFEIDLVRDLFNKFKINHTFTNFIRKHNYDMIIFLGPSMMSKYCKEISFISNIWDLDHKKNSQFPEHNKDFTFEYKEKLIKEIIFRAFKIVVAHQSNKNDLLNFYKVSEEKVVVQDFIPMLPTLYLKKANRNLEYNQCYLNLNLPLNKKIIFYPAQFWAHKNHKYIIDAAEILKNKNDENYFFVFCGGSKGNYKYIKNLITKKKLDEYIKILMFISDDEIISLYLNSHAVVMPTYCGPTNLPIYESFFFKKIIFYTKDLIPNDKINERLIEIDISLPSDFCEKLKLCFDDTRIKEITDDNYEYFKKICSEDKFKDNYKKILDEFSYLLSRWK